MASSEVLQRIDPRELRILQLRGAFELPPKSIQDDLIDLFFRWVAPVVPVIQEAAFRQRYNDPSNPPSLLLLQAIFMTVTPVSATSETCNSHTSSSARTSPFFRRAKALYDAGYERDQITVVQSLVLMSWYWYGPQENGLFYWSRLAITVAQDIDMHRSSELTHLSQSDRRLWKRIWWTLFTRDRAVAAAWGRPVCIFLEHCNVERITENDFVESQGYAPNAIHVQFFIQYVKLCEVQDIVVCRPLVKMENGKDIFAGCESEMNRWLLNCPEELRWQQSSHNFWSALLHCGYNTMLCQLHGLRQGIVKPAQSQLVASEAASMIISAAESLVCHDQIQFSPPLLIYSLFTVLATVKSQLSSAIPTIVLQSKRKVNTCLLALGLLSKKWPITRMITETSETVFSDKFFAELFETAANAINGTGEYETMLKHRFKKTLPRQSQSCQDLMLPRSRMVVKMTFANLSSQRESVKLKDLGSHPELRLIPNSRFQDPSFVSGMTRVLRSFRGLSTPIVKTNIADKVGLSSYQSFVKGRASSRKRKFDRRFMPQDKNKTDPKEHVTQEKSPLPFDNSNSDSPPTISFADAENNTRKDMRPAFLALDNDLSSTQSVDFEEWDTFLNINTEQR